MPRSARDYARDASACLLAPNPGPYAELSDRELEERLRAGLPRLVDFWRGGNLKAGDLLRRIASGGKTDGELVAYPLVLECREDLRAILTPDELAALGI